MVVLDTNVVSELMHREPDEKVLIWIDNQPTQELFVTSVTEAEIRAGIAFLPEGVRRRGLAEAAGHTFSDLFAGRILPFDSAAACVYAEIVAVRRASGRPISQADGQIAAALFPSTDSAVKSGRRGLKGRVLSKYSRCEKLATSSSLASWMPKKWRSFSVKSGSLLELSAKNRKGFPSLIPPLTFSVVSRSSRAPIKSIAFRTYISSPNRLLHSACVSSLPA